MKKLSFYISLFLILFSSIIATSCKGLLSPDSDSENALERTKDGWILKGNLSLDKTFRTAMPDLALTSTFEVYVHPEGDASTKTAGTIEGSTYKVGIPSDGKWVITVNYGGMLDGGGNVTGICFSGSATVTIENSLIKVAGSENIVLKPLQDSSLTSMVSLPIEVSNDSEILSAKILDDSGTLINSLDFSASKSQIYTDVLNAGNYKYHFVFYNEKGAQVYVFTEVVTVYNNLTTDKWINSSSVPYITSGKVYITKTIIQNQKNTTFYVSDTGTTGASGGYQEPLNSVQEAVNIIQTANDGASEYRIILCSDMVASAAGDYTTAADSKKTYVAIDPSSDLKLTIESAPGHTYKIDASASSGGTESRVIYSTGNVELNLKNVEVTGGYVENADGAGIYKSGGKLYLNDAIIDYNNGLNSINDSSINGMGIRLLDSYLEINGNSSISYNEGTSAAGVSGINIVGGGVYCTGTEVVINNGTFSNNKAIHGGFISVQNSSSLKIADGTFTNNETSNTGACIWSNCYFEINGGTFTGNKSTSNDGGVIYYRTWGTSVSKITGGTFTGNSARNGGVICLGNTTDYTCKLEISGGAFKNNTAIRSGSAIANISSANLKLTGSVNFDQTGSTKQAVSLYENINTNVIVPVTLGTTTSNIVLTFNNLDNNYDIDDAVGQLCVDGITTQAQANLFEVYDKTGTTSINASYFISSSGKLLYKDPSIVYVSTTGDNSSYSSPDTAFTDLKAALTYANQDPAVQTIIVCDNYCLELNGSYSINGEYSGAAPGSRSNLTIKRYLTSSGASQNELFFAGNSISGTLSIKNVILDGGAEWTTNALGTTYTNDVTYRSLFYSASTKNYSVILGAGAEVRNCYALQNIIYFTRSGTLTLEGGCKIYSNCAYMGSIISLTDANLNATNCIIGGDTADEGNYGTAIAYSINSTASDTTANIGISGGAQTDVVIKNNTTAISMTYMNISDNTVLCGSKLNLYPCTIESNSSAIILERGRLFADGALITNNGIGISGTGLCDVSLLNTVVVGSTDITKVGGIVLTMVNNQGAKLYIGENSVINGNGALGTDRYDIVLPDYGTGTKAEFTISDSPLIGSIYMPAKTNIKVQGSVTPITPTELTFAPAGYSNTTKAVTVDAGGGITIAQAKTLFTVKNDSSGNAWEIGNNGYLKQAGAADAGGHISPAGSEDIHALVDKTIAINSVDTLITITFEKADGTDISTLVENVVIDVYSDGTSLNAYTIYFSRDADNHTVTVKKNIPAGTPVTIRVSYDYNGISGYSDDFDITITE